MKSLIQEKTLIMMKKMIPLAKKKVKMLTFWTTLVIWTSLICLNKIKMQFQNRTQTTVATVTSLTLMLQQHRVNRVKHKLNKNQSKKLIFSLYQIHHLRILNQTFLTHQLKTIYSQIIVSLLYLLLLNQTNNMITSLICSRISIQIYLNLPSFLNNNIKTILSASNSSKCQCRTSLYHKIWDKIHFNQ